MNTTTLRPTRVWDLPTRVFHVLLIACFAGAVLTDLVVAWALWVFFAPVDRRLSAIAAWCRVVYAVAFGIAVTSLASAANALGAGSNPSGPVQREAMADITRFQDIWALSLGLFGVHLLLIGLLAFRSGYVPRWIGALVAISGAGYVIDTIGGLFSGYSLEVGAVTFVGEVVLMIWLLVRGRSVRRYLNADLLEQIGARYVSTAERFSASAWPRRNSSLRTLLPP